MDHNAENARNTFLPPEDLYGELFYDVQNDPRLFHDSKTFVDAIPLFSVDEILDRFAKHRDRSTEGLRSFLVEHFRVPSEHVEYVSDSVDIKEHIRKLWKILKRRSEQPSGTLLPLPCDYIVPGGRFREMYYWDSYFIILGLILDEEHQTVKDMVCNFQGAITSYGFVPTGNRTYYLSRSQPPVFSLIARRVAMNDKEVLLNCAPYIEKEYNYWMSGADTLSAEMAWHRRVVYMPGGEVLNRYYDDRAMPRPESYLEDHRTLEEAKLLLPGKADEEVFRDIRAAAESGWDFSSRWMLPDENRVYKMGTLHTTEIIPVDLNSFMFHAEETLAEAHAQRGDTTASEAWRNRAEARRDAVLKYCWDDKRGFFMDYNFKRKTHTNVFSLAAVYPLRFGMATPEQAALVAQKLYNEFLQQGGLLTTLNVTGQQWDAPNGWAPLHYAAYLGLMKYGYKDLAVIIRDRWMRLIEKTYLHSARLLEKYNVYDPTREGGGGEYPNQDGFGWTNGVYRYFAHEKEQEVKPIDGKAN